MIMSHGGVRGTYALGSDWPHVMLNKQLAHPIGSPVILSLCYCQLLSSVLTSAVSFLVLILQLLETVCTGFS